MADPVRIVVLDGDETGQELLEQSLRVLDPSVAGLEIDFAKLSVYDVGALGEKFDLVIFMGVLYHLRHPLLALDLIHEHVAGDLLLFQSMLRGSADVASLAEDYPIAETAIFDTPTFPKMSFVERRYSNDETNWWIPNRACAEAMLRSAGFDIMGQIEEIMSVTHCAPLAFWMPSQNIARMDRETMAK